MDTPICDFVRSYCGTNALRLHMPGHKGTGPLGVEALDITEIRGADSLYEASGIIRQSEENASRLFGCPTYYATEGSSLCIRAMLYLCCLYAAQLGKRPLIAAGRNAHRTLVSAAALLDFDLVWLYPEKEDSYLSCTITPRKLALWLDAQTEKPLAVYLTSPDYLGQMADIAAIAEVCHRRGCLLLVDNAHGAYLRFLPRSLHPMDLGADLCCDSAHKTLPVLTGGAYLHLSAGMPALFQERVRDAFALFGSTSPSYLILQSLDAANRYLADGCRQSLASFAEDVCALKAALETHGYSLTGTEPMKLTIDAAAFGYTGKELETRLLADNIVCEFADMRCAVMMLTPEIGSDGLSRLKKALLNIPPQTPLELQHPTAYRPIQARSVRETVLSPCQKLPLPQCAGKIFAGSNIACPPAVPIVVCGELLDEAALELLAAHGVESCPVLVTP